MFYVSQSFVSERSENSSARREADVQDQPSAAQEALEKEERTRKDLKADYDSAVCQQQREAEEFDCLENQQLASENNRMRMQGCKMRYSYRSL